MFNICRPIVLFNLLFCIDHPPFDWYLHYAMLNLLVRLQEGGKVPDILL